MAYCTKDDILARLTEEILIDLTDDEDAGQVNDAFVDKAIAAADGLINAHAGERYTVPLDPVPDLLRDASVELAIYNLYSRRRGAPEEWQERYKNNTRLLEKLAKGEINLGAEDPSRTPQATPVNITSSKRVFSRKLLKDF
jgi:phage gp36-like protein